MKRKTIIRLITLLVVVYLAIGTLVTLRTIWRAIPQDAADLYLNAIMERDTARIYLYSDMLGPHLASMMEDSNLSEDARKHMWGKDYARWKTEFEKGSKASDSLKRERRLLNGQIDLTKMDGIDFKAEVYSGEVSDLFTYQDDPGGTYHYYYQLTYPSPDVAPTVAILDNIRSGQERRIKAVTVRVEVAKRPDVKAPRTWILQWEWLDDVAFAFPHRLALTPADPSEVWMVKVSFAVDKLHLETF